MRLTSAQIDTIKSTATAVLGEGVQVTLFGSRVDDAAKGGDVDLMVEVNQVLLEPALAAARIASRVSRAMHGRKVDVLTFSHVICRPTEKEARDYVQYIVDENADWEATDNLIRLQLAHALSFPHDLLTQIRYGFALGHGGFPLIGTPDQVAAGIISLHEAGFAGTTLSFVDYLREFPYFAEEVLPRVARDILHVIE